MDYTEELCPVCNREFEPDDDIVVCPDCGTPHHRECYMIEKTCANAAKHGTGFKWNRKEYIPGPEDAVFTVCPVCRFPNDSSEESCVRCGARIHTGRTAVLSNENVQPQQNDQGQDPAFGDELAFLGLNPNEDMGGSTLGEVSTFVVTSKFYYIPIFKRMKDRGKKISFNFSCLVFPSLYFANRRMWFWAVFVGLMGLVLSMPSMALNFAANFSDFSEMESYANAVNRHKHFIQELESVFSIADWALRIFYCLFGNWFYFRYVKHSIKKLRAKSTDGKADPAALTEAGGVRPANMLIIIGIMFGAGLIAVYAMAMLLTRL